MFSDSRFSSRFKHINDTHSNVKLRNKIKINNKIALININ